MIRSLDLFSGYGGLALALMPWCRPIAYVEKEEYAQRILSERMADGSLPRAPLLGDVQNVEGSPGVCDLISAGFPCQDISVAGNKDGLAGKRSGLYGEVVRLTEEIQPSFVLLENVPAIRSNGLFFVAQDYAQMGYDCRWTSVSASAVGAPHRRERWFFLAYSNSQPIRDRRERRKVNQAKANAFTSDDGQKGVVADPMLKGLQKRERKQPASKYLRAKCASGEELYQWELEPDVGRVVDGCSFRVDRLKALGNGVVPLQARAAFELLVGLHERA